MIFIKRSTIFKIVALVLLLAGGILSLVLALNEEIPQWLISSQGEVSKGPNPIYGYLLYLGDGSILMLIAAIPALFGDSEYKHKKAFPLAVTTIIGCFLSEGLRTLFGSLAPNNIGIKSVVGISMPCPPVMNSTAFALTLGILIFRYMKNKKGKALAISFLSLMPIITSLGGYFGGLFDVTDITAAICFGGMLPIIMSLVVPKGDAQND